VSSSRCQLRWLLDNVRRLFPELIEIYDNTASLQERTVLTGILKPALAQQFGAIGYVSRASGACLSCWGPQTAGAMVPTRLPLDDAPGRLCSNIALRVFPTRARGAFRPTGPGSGTRASFLSKLDTDDTKRERGDIGAIQRACRTGV
jgi:hypothetical protein